MPVSLFDQQEQSSKQDGLLKGLLANLTDLHAQVASLALDRGGVTPSQLAAEKDSLLRIINELAANLTLYNSTLSNKVQWTTDDQKKDHVSKRIRKGWTLLPVNFIYNNTS